MFIYSFDKFLKVNGAETLAGAIGGSGSQRRAVRSRR